MKSFKIGQMLKTIWSKKRKRRGQQDYESDQIFDDNFWYPTVFDICYI